MNCRNSGACKCEKEKTCGICDVERGIRELEEGLRLAGRGLELVRACDLCEGIRCLELAARELTKGLATLAAGLENTRFMEGCSRREIEEMLCVIEKYIDCIERAIEALCNGETARGIAMVEEAICCIAKELKKLRTMICGRERERKCGCSR